MWRIFSNSCRGGSRLAPSGWWKSLLKPEGWLRKDDRLADVDGRVHVDNLALVVAGLVLRVESSPEFSAILGVCRRLADHPRIGGVRSAGIVQGKTIGAVCCVRGHALTAGK